MPNSNCKSNTLNQPAISKFVGQKTSTHNSPVLTKKILSERTHALLSKGQMKNTVQWKEMKKKTNTKATLPKTLQPKLIKEDWGIDLLHEIQLLRDAMNKNHSELSMEVDSTTTELKSDQLSLSKLIGLPANVEKLEDTIAHLLSKNTHLEAENMLFKKCPP